MSHRALLAACLASLPVAATAPAQTVTGPEFAVFGRTAFQPRHPDVAYDRDSDRYLVVWSFADGVHARLVRDDGTGFGAGSIRVAATSGYVQPVVANINERDAFVVVWTEQPGIIKARAVFANGALSNTVSVATVNQITPNLVDVAGEAADQPDAAVAVYPDQLSSSTTIMRAKLLVISRSGTLAAFPSQRLASISGRVLDVRVAHTGGPHRRLLVVWRRLTTTLGAFGMVCGMDLTPLTSPFPIATDTIGSVDGDGRTWVVAARAAAFSITFDPRTGTVAQTANGLSSSPFAFAKAASWLGGSAAIADVSSPPFSIQQDLYARSADPFTVELCEPQFALEQDQNDTVFGASSAANGGGGDASRALFVWAEGDNNTTAIQARTLFVSDGVSRDLGGGCGLGGEAFASCARADHAAFTLRARHDIDIFTRGVLLVSPRRLDAPCSGCVLVPDPAVGIAVIKGTGITSFKEVPIAMPPFASLRGVTFYTQWALLRIGNTCSPLGADLSNALEVTIQ